MYYDKTNKEKERERHTHTHLPRPNLLGAGRYNSAEENAIAFALSNDWIWPSLQ